MKLTIETKVAQAAVKSLAKVVPAKPSLVIMGHLHIDADDGVAVLTGSDLDMTMRISVSADGMTDAAWCLPFAPLSEFVGKAKGGEITVEVADGIATLSSARNRVKLSTMPGAGYPATNPPVPAAAEIDPKAVGAAVRFCAASVEDSEVRYHIAGAHLATLNGTTHAWGTDGKSVHHVAMPEIPGIGAATIPVAACAVVVAMLDGADTAQMGLGENGWHIVTPGVTAWGKVIDGGYPDMQSVLKQFKDWSDMVPQVRASDLVEAVDMASIGADRDSTRARNVVVKAGDGITIRGHKGTSGVMSAGRATLDCAAVPGFGAILNGDKMRAAANGLGGMLTITQSDSKAIRIIGADMPDAEAIIMAMPAMQQELADD